MRLHEVDFEFLYTWGDDEERNTKVKAQIEERRQFLDGIGVQLGETDRENSHPQKVLMSDDQLLECIVARFKTTEIRPRIFKGRGVEDIGGINDIMDKFHVMAAKLLALPSAERAYNEKCTVHMPGQALATYNEVMLLEDSCSDELQRQLDNGWRIITACPQPDARRPDYILGRFNEKRDLGYAQAVRP